MYTFYFLTFLFLMMHIVTDCAMLQATEWFASFVLLLQWESVCCPFPHFYLITHPMHFIHLLLLFFHCAQSSQSGREKIVYEAIKWATRLGIKFLCREFLCRTCAGNNQTSDSHCFDQNRTEQKFHIIWLQKCDSNKYIENVKKMFVQRLIQSIWGLH